MRLSPAIVIGAFALAACGEREAAPAPADKVAAETPTSDAVQAPAALSAGDLRRVCVAGLAAIHGQQTADLSVEGAEGGVVRASWRAPVDGGRMRAECRVENDLIVWKPLNLPDASQVRWMNQSGDPVVRYVMDGDTITITQTLPDGTTERTALAVPAEEEAR